MTEFIVLTLVSFLCILGLADIIHAIRLCVFSPKNKAITYLVIYLKADDPESQLKYVGEQYLWQGRRLADNVIAVNTALSEDASESCEKIAEKYNIIFCSSDELCNAVELLSGKM